MDVLVHTKRVQIIMRFIVVHVMLYCWADAFRWYTYRDHIWSKVEPQGISLTEYLKRFGNPIVLLADHLNEIRLIYPKVDQGHNPADKALLVTQLVMVRLEHDREVLTKVEVHRLDIQGSRTLPRTTESA